MSVGGIGVLLGGIDVLVGGTGVSVGSIGVGCRWQINADKSRPSAVYAMLKTRQVAQEIRIFSPKSCVTENL